MPSCRQSFALKSLTCSIILLSSGHLLAGGLDLPTITASHQGTSNANGAEAADPSVIYYNPAGLARLKGGLQVSQGVSALLIRGQVEVEEARGTPPITDQPNSEGRDLSTDPRASGSSGSFWPQVLGAGGLFASMPISENMTAGLGIFAPGGGNLNYKKNWPGAYQIDSIAIELINVNPSVGIRFDDQHSVGFGVSVIGGHIRQRTQIDVPGVAPYLIKSAVDNDALTVGGLLPLGGIISSVCGSPLDPLDIAGSICEEAYDLTGGQLTTPESNGSALVEMYGYGLGFNAGYMFAFNDNTRIGLAYRSASKIKLRGDLEWDLKDIQGGTLFQVLQPALGVDSLEEYLRENLRPDTTTKGNLYLPARTSANIFHKLNNRIDLMADFTFIETATTDKIRVQFLDKTIDGKRIKQGAGGIDANWRNSFKVSVGGNYHFDDKLTLKSGFQYDKTPVPNAESRHPGAPDSDRYMLSIGANYKYKKDLSFDAAYSYMMLADADSNYRDRCRVTNRENADGSFNENGESCTGNGGSFKGRYHDTYIQTLSIQMNKKF